MVFVGLGFCFSFFFFHLKCQDKVNFNFMNEKRLLSLSKLKTHRKFKDHSITKDIRQRGLITER